MRSDPARELRVAAVGGASGVGGLERDAPLWSGRRGRDGVSRGRELGGDFFMPQNFLVFYLFQPKERAKTKGEGAELF